MDKRILAGIGLSGLLMVGSVLSVSAQSTGYESYKAALKQMSTVKNVTNDVKVTIQDNHQTLFSLSAIAKIDKENNLQNKSVILEKAGQKEELEIFDDNQNTIIRNVKKDEYYGWDNPRRSFRDKEDKDGIQKDLEPVIDALTHNLQKQFTSKEREDGTKEIDVQLTNDEIPMVVNAVSAFLIKQGSNHERFGENKTKDPGLMMRDMKPDFPKLRDEIKIEKFHLKAHLDNAQYLDDQTVEFMVSGTDEQGNRHELEFQVEMDFSKFNQTSVQPLDLEGKTVQIIEKHWKKFGRPE